MTGHVANTDLVTGALSYSGSRIAEILLASGRKVRTLTYHPDRVHRRERVQVSPYRFDDSSALVRSLEGIATLYNTYWVRFERGRIARPTWLFGGGRDILVSNIAWFLRHVPVFGLPGDGRYLVQPIHVDDFAGICVEAAQDSCDEIRDAAGPDPMSFEQLVRAVRDAVGTRPPIVHLPPIAMAVIARAFGLITRDVVLTTDEIRGLTAGLLVSHHAALGRTSFLSWLRESGPTLGHSYSSEVDRHFRR